MSADIDNRIRLAAAASAQLRSVLSPNSGSTLAVRVQLYSAIVKATLTYGGAEAWALSQTQRARLDAFHTRQLRRIAGVQRGEGEPSNADVYARTKSGPVTALVAKARLRWLGHVARMDKGCLTHRLLFAAEVPGGARGVGAPHLTWVKAVHEDLEERGLADTWLEVAQDRVEWRRKALS